MREEKNWTKNRIDLDRVREQAMDFADVGIHRYKMNGEIVFIDRGTLRLLDLETEYPDPNVLVGKDIGTLFEHIIPAGSLREATLKRGEVRQFEYHYRTLSGKERWAYQSSYLVRDPDIDEDLIQVFTQDITELKRITASLESSRERYRALAEQSEQGIGVLGRESSKLLFVNSALARIMGSTIEELLSQSAEDIWRRVDPKDMERVHSYFTKRRRTEDVPSSYEARIVRPDETVRWVSTHVFAIDFDGEPAFQFVTTDITEQKDAEKRRREQELQRLHSKKLESLGMLAGGVAHDFNNLLLAIMGNAELAKTRMPSDEQIAHHLERICEISEQASTLCGQLLAFAGRGHFDKQKMCLNDLVEKSSQLIDVSISTRALLEYGLSRDLPPIEADLSQVQQILLNLIINAAEAMGNEPGTVTIETGTRHCTREYLDGTQHGLGLAEGEYVFFSVSDDGPGMDQETKAQLFEPFFTTKFTGRGLGLASVLGILRSHRGTIEVESRIGHGACFTVLFPRAAEEPEAPSRTSHPPPLFETEGLVLVADDEPFVLQSAAAILEDLGFEVLTAENGERAVELFAANADRLRLAVLDITMPKMNGLSACRLIRDRRPDLPVLFTSGYNEHDLRSDLESFETVGFIRKPYRIFELEKRLAELLR